MNLTPSVWKERLSPQVPTPLNQGNPDPSFLRFCLGPPFFSEFHSPSSNQFLSVTPPPDSSCPSLCLCSRDLLLFPHSSQASLQSSNVLDSLTLCIFALLGYAITVHNGTFTWAQDLPPTLHRYHQLLSLTRQLCNVDRSNIFPTLLASVFDRECKKNLLLTG